MKKVVKKLLVPTLSATMAFGMAISADAATQQSNGWKQVGNQWTYYKDGKAVTGWQTIDGKEYCFDNKGVMYTKYTSYGEDRAYDLEKNGRYGYYRFNEDGSIVKGWYEVINDNGESEYYYYDAKTGIAVNYEVKVIDGKTYYFNYQGEMTTSEVRKVYNSKTQNYEFYKIDENGEATKFTPKNNQWVQAGENWYYFGNEKNYDGCSPALIGDGIKTVDGKKYYFQSGKMCTNYSVSSYDSESGKYKDYYVTEDGTFAAGWVWVKNEKANYGGWRYYDKTTNERVSDKWVDGYYVNHNGYMVTSATIITVDGAASFDENGKCISKVTSSGWVKTYDGEWKYYDATAKEFKSSEFVKSNGKTYYVDGSGDMVTSTRYSIYTDSKDYVYYSFDENGVMQTGWVKKESTSSTTWYYYDADGKAHDGWLNDTYYFSNGEMKADTYVSEAKKDENGNYVADKTGHIVYKSIYLFDTDGKKITSNGWHKVGGSWYYVNNGKVTVSSLVKDGGDWYYFDRYGVMVTGSTYSDDDNKELYHFNNEGKMDVRLNTNDKSTKTGWYSATTTTGQKIWYYVTEDSNGKLKISSDEWVKSGGKWYYFDSSCTMKTSSVIYNYEKDANGEYKYDENGYRIIEGVYVAGSDGAMLANQWYETSNGYWYYLGADGKAYSNKWLKSGGKWYYFGELGNMLTSETYIEKDKKYAAFNDAGVFQGYVGEKTWVQDGADWKYLVNGKYATGLQTIGGKKYMFSTSGVMYNNQTISKTVINSDGEKETINYYAKDGGVLAQNEWVCSSNGSWYYAQADNTLATGWKTIKGEQYYFSTGSGYMYKDTVTSVYNSELSRTIYAAFDKDGKMVKNQWVKIGSDWYYADRNGQLPQGLNKINGAVYKITTNGGMKIGYINSGSTTLHFGTDGKLIGSVPSDKTGWVEENGYWYYIEDGKTVSGFKTIGGKKYYFTTDSTYGYVMANDPDKSYHISGNYYRFGTDGVMLANKWYETSRNSWNYYKADGTRADSEWVKIGGKWYYFNGSTMAKNTTISINGKLYAFDENGNYNEVTMKGWQLVNKAWYYFNGGKSFTGWTGDYYISSNKMVSDTTVNYNGYYYVLDAEGKYVKNAWYKDSYNTWYYALPTGKLATGWKVIGGDWYFFNSSGAMATGTFTVNGTTYYADENGKYVGKVSKGWISSGDDWYYVNASGNLYSGTFATIGGKKYYFNYDGTMLKNAVQNVYSTGKVAVFGADGAMVTGWVYLDDVINKDTTLSHTDISGWYYSNYVSTSVNGNTLFTDKNGKTYLLSSTGKMLTGIQTVKGEKVLFDASGVRVGVMSDSAFKKGWVNASGSWYYYTVDNGVGNLLSSTWKKIDGKWYYFKADGKMACDEMYNGYKFDANGNAVTSTWVTFNDASYYFGANGLLAKGVNTVGGVRYIFASNGKLLQ